MNYVSGNEETATKRRVPLLTNFSDLSFTSTPSETNQGRG